jgi:excisionase family DNA binding protein
VEWNLSRATPLLGKDLCPITSLMVGMTKKDFVLEALETLHHKVDSLMQDLDKPLTTEEAAEYTGLSISYLRKLTSGRRIPHFKSDGGSRIYFRKADLHDWMLKRYVKTNQQARIEVIDVF